MNTISFPIHTNDQHSQYEQVLQRKKDILHNFGFDFSIFQIFNLTQQSQTTQHSNQSTSNNTQLSAFKKVIIHNCSNTNVNSNSSISLIPVKTIFSDNSDNSAGSSSNSSSNNKIFNIHKINKTKTCTQILSANGNNNNNNYKQVKLPPKMVHKCTFPSCDRIFSSSRWLRAHFNDHLKQMKTKNFNILFEKFIAQK